MINKGELCMEYQNTDDAVRRDACERVKQIVKAIKAIKIRYYLNFSKISEKDQETYQKLQDNLDNKNTTIFIIQICTNTAIPFSVITRFLLTGWLSKNSAVLSFSSFANAVTARIAAKNAPPIPITFPHSMA